MTTRRLLVLVATGAGIAVIGGSAVGVGPFSPLIYRTTSISANGGLAAVAIQAVPEGPPPNAVPLAQLEPYVPDPLPAPLFQWFCSQGGDLTVTLGNGTTVTYGPCYRPDAINRLWARYVFVATDGACAAKCGPNGESPP
jgi:hypothetical protein